MCLVLIPFVRAIIFMYLAIQMAINQALKSHSPLPTDRTTLDIYAVQKYSGLSESFRCFYWTTNAEDIIVEYNAWIGPWHIFVGDLCCINSDPHTHANYTAPYTFDATCWFHSWSAARKLAEIKWKSQRRRAKAKFLRTLEYFGPQTADSDCLLVSQQKAKAHT